MTKRMNVIQVMVAYQHFTDLELPLAENLNETMDGYCPYGRA
jgi:hypothetical protein